MDAFEELLNFVIERIETVSKTETIIGEPFEAGGRRFVPLIEVKMGFFGGGVAGDGNATERDGDRKSKGRGHLGGTGGGIRIKPVGVIYQEGDETHYLTVGDAKRDHPLVETARHILVKKKKPTSDEISDI